MIYEVGNIYEAYELVSKFKKEKKYHWFRGQAKNWKVNSTLLRLKKTEVNKAIKKLERFTSWMQADNVIGNSYDDIDKIMAIAQHYGLSTNFVDFTTDLNIAFYFCTQKKWARKTWISTIICINTDELNDFINLFKHRLVFAELLDIKIMDLWRLTAQSGKFLFLPLLNFENLFEFDRVNFPYAKEFKYVSKSQVYPKRKSPLEVNIDSYFENEKKITFLEYVKNNKIESHEYKFEDGSYEVFNMTIKEHKSWSLKNTNKWINKTNVPLPKESDFYVLELKIEYCDDLSSLFEEVKNKISSKLTEVTNLQSKYLSWKISFSNNLKIDSSILELYWDGVKSLPFCFEDIIIGFSNCIILQLDGKSTLNSDDSFFNFLGPTLFVELSSNQAVSRAVVSIEEFKKCFRSDIKLFLSDQAILENNLEKFLLCCNNVRLFFDFNKLTKLFLNQLIPTQILLSGGLGSIINSPAKVEILGLA